MNVSSDIEFISVGCNCLGDCLVWGQNKLAAYGAQNFVALFDPIQSKVLSTLPGHKDRVNHIVWVPNVNEEYNNRYLSNENELISCSSDNTIISWKQIKDGKNYQYKIVEILKGHNDSVTNLSVLDYPDGSLLMCSTSADNTVKLWKRESISKQHIDNDTLPNWTLIQSIDFIPRGMECCSLAFLPGTTIPLLALGGLESKIHIYIENTDNTSQPLQFKKLMSLQGHQDWIKSLSFTTNTIEGINEDEQELILASSSQDFKIRLWKISKFTIEKQKQQQLDSESGGSGTNLLGSLSTQLSGVTSLSTKGYLFNCNSNKYIILLDAVLSGHDDWVYSIHWSPARKDEKSGKKVQDMLLISASMDKTAIVWRPDRATGIWIDESRVGDMGGNILGLYGAVFSPCSQYILSHGYNGAFHFWKQSLTNKTFWEPKIVVSGHFGPVQDLMWSPDYSYFISSSTDRTLRLFSEWKRDNEQQQQLLSWNEIARPQIHGYDLECFSFIFKKSHVIVSGAEEKIMRVFVGSQNFVDTLYNISKVEPNLDDDDDTQRPLAANQPSLGLSNKPYFTGEGNGNEDGDNNTNEMKIAGGGEGGGGGGGEEMDTGYFENELPFNPEVLNEPPLEEHLLQSSLWPEIHKLYGHGNEMIAVACSGDGKYLASACRASSADQATVRIWNVSNWKECANLKGHTLTVVNLTFSHDSRYLLGVSRDRMWTLWERTENPNEPFVKVICAPKAHGRIIWSGSWSHDSKYFATGARDKVVKIWNLALIKDIKNALASTLPTFGSGVTCVEFAPSSLSSKLQNNPHVLACGEDDGKITIWKSSTNSNTSTNGSLDWTCIHTISPLVSHTCDVRKIRWRDTPIINDDNSITYQLASCSLDHSVRLFNIKFNL